MHLSFLKELLPQHTIELSTENNTECAYIKHEQFEGIIEVRYWPDDYYTYYFQFATQHRETSSKEDLVDYVLAFVNAEKAAIEFYDDGKKCFGGEIETALLGSLTYDSLRKYFDYSHLDLSNLSFEVRAWDKRFCFNGKFVKDASDAIVIFKLYSD